MVGETALTQNLKVSGLGDIDNWGFFFTILVLLSGGFGDQAPELIYIESRTKILVFIHSEHTHSFLSEVAGVVFIHKDSVVMLTTGVTATRGVLSVFAHTTVTMGHMTSHLAGFLHRGSLS